MSKHHPFGIYIEDHEELVREVISVTEKGELVCAANVPENAVLNIMKGEVPSLVHSAEQALEDCFTEDNKDIRYCFVIDCIGRSIFLNEDFKEELGAITNRLNIRNIDTVPEGVVSLGEIASMGEDMLELLNKTIVVGIFHE